MRALEVCSRRGDIQIHVYFLPLPYHVRLLLHILCLRNDSMYFSVRVQLHNIEYQPQQYDLLLCKSLKIIQRRFVLFTILSDCFFSDFLLLISCNNWQDKLITTWFIFSNHPVYFVVTAEVLFEV